MIRVAFIIRRFGRGGAERQLVELLRHLDKARFAPTVICFYPGGGLWDEVRQIPGIVVRDLAKSSRWDVRPLWRLAAYLRRTRPDVIHGYMDTANVLAALGGTLTGARVVWGVRASGMDLSQYDWLHRVASIAERVLSPAADLVICNSEAGRADVVARRIARDNVVVIRNGIDTVRFRPDGAARERVRAEWGVRPEECLIGLPARLDPMKGHAVFIAAAGDVARRAPHARFVCVGGGPDRLGSDLQAQATAAGLDGRLVWAGERPDMADVLPALDLAVSASRFGEGFSNALAEAMACGVPCVATRIGDAADIVGDQGWLAPPGDVPALAGAMEQALAAIAAGRVNSGAVRARIERHFGLDRLAASTAAVLADLANVPAPPAAAGRR